MPSLSYPPETNRAMKSRRLYSHHSAKFWSKNHSVSSDDDTLHTGTRFLLSSAALLNDATELICFLRLQHGAGSTTVFHTI